MKIANINPRVKHISPHTKRKIQTLPITGNYLIPESDGQLCWAEPNDSWRIYANAGNQRMFISNIRFDDTDHSSDLWLYSLLTVDEKKVTNGMLEEYGVPKPAIESTLMEQNRRYLDPSRKWYVRQFVDNPDRAGIKRFAGIPLNAWRCMWRRTIALEDMEIYGLSSNQMRIMFAGLTFNTFLKWPELQSDMDASVVTTQHDGTRLQISQNIMPWLAENCREGIIPFSDYDSMFPDECDEIIYSIDKAGVS